MDGKYSEEEARVEAEKIQELVGKSGTKADYRTAEKMVDEEAQKERAERALEKLRNILKVYRSIVGELDADEITDIELNHGGERGYYFRAELSEKEVEGINFYGGSMHENEAHDNGFVSILKKVSPEELDARDPVEHILDAVQRLDHINIYNNNKDAWIKLLDTDMDEFVKEYQEVLIKISETQQRAIGPERQMKLLENLENSRKKMHDDMADNLRSSLRKNRFPIGKENARHLLALAFEMRRNLKQRNVFDLRPDQIEQAQKIIKEKLGLDSEAYTVNPVGGMHELEGLSPLDAAAQFEYMVHHKIKVIFPEDDLTTRENVLDVLQKEGIFEG
jgi:hypothetical protein